MLMGVYTVFIDILLREAAKRKSRYQGLK